jgi:DNA polymerase elongation subunit (family B)
MRIEYLGEYESDLYDITIEGNNNFFGNDILVHNCDTDSAYLNTDPLVKAVFGDKEISNDKLESFLDKVGTEKITPVLKQAYDKLAETMGAYRNAMSMKREKIIKKMLFLGKKHYILIALNSEGVHYDQPKMSVTGMESVKSSTPAICREQMESIYEVIMDEDEKKAQDFIAEFKEVFRTLKPSEIAKNSGTPDIMEYSDKINIYRGGTPIHIRGSLLHNSWIKQKGLDNKYPLIQSGDKIKFLYLKVPNPIRENVISFNEELPAELNLHKYIDYDTQFEKVFEKPIRNMFDILGWKTEKVDDLSSFFN